MTQASPGKSGVPSDASGTPPPILSTAEELKTARDRLIKVARIFANVWKYKGLPQEVTGQLFDHLDKVRKEVDLVPLDLARLYSHQFEPVSPDSPLTFAELYNDGFLVIVLMKMPAGFSFQHHDHPHMVAAARSSPANSRSSTCSWRTRRPFPSTNQRSEPRSGPQWPASC